MDRQRMLPDYNPIVEFKTLPCTILYNSNRDISLSLIELKDHYVLKASKHFFIRAMETVGDTNLYSKLQEIGNFADYLKQNVAEWHVQTYYINSITPRIAINNFRHEPLLQKKLSEWENNLRLLGQMTPAEEQVMKQKLDLLKLAAGSPDALVTEIEKWIHDREEVRRQWSALDKYLKDATSVLNEWVEKGYAIAILWTISTSFVVSAKPELESEVKRLEAEIDKIWNQHVKSRAFQQHVWIEEVKDPVYTIHAEYTGLFHPSIREIYKRVPLLESFASDLEATFSARLQKPIERDGYREDSSTAVAEALAAFLRHVKKIQEMPSHVLSRIDYTAIEQPVYMGLLVTAQEGKFEETNYPFVFDTSCLTRHVLITGTSGSGKTRVGQLITEGTFPEVAVVIFDPMGEFTGLIQENPNVAKELQFRIPKGCSFTPIIYTLDEGGLKFEANLLKRPPVKDDRLVSEADEVALVLCELVGDERLRDIFRKVLLEAWNKGDLEFDDFMAGCRNEASQRRISVKLDRLAPYKSLMGRSVFDVQSLLHGITIFTFNSSRYTDSEKLMFMWFILRELKNYFLNQQHSDQLKLLVVVDEAHRFYSEGMPKVPASVLESLNKEGRGKGLGMVVLTQTIKDLPEIFTQADMRILLRIAEGEIQTYGMKYGLELARRLRTLGPREGYVFSGSEQFFCRFRPTVSNPKGVTYSELLEYSAPNRALQTAVANLIIHQGPTFPTARPVQPNQALKAVSLTKPDLKQRAIETLKSKDGISVSELGRTLEIHSQAVLTKLVNSLESEGSVVTKKVATKRKIWLKPVSQSPKSKSSLEKV